MRVDATGQRTNFRAITTDDSFIRLAKKATREIVDQYKKTDSLKKDPIGERFNLVLSMHQLTEKIQILTIKKTKVTKNAIGKLLDYIGGSDIESIEESSLTQESLSKRIDLMTGEEHRLKVKKQQEQKQAQKAHEKWAQI